MTNGFMHTSNSPFSRTLQPTTNTFATWNFHGHINISTLTGKGQSPFSRLRIITIFRTPSLNRMIAWHNTSQPKSTTHRRCLKILTIRLSSSSRKQTFRTSTGHFSTLFRHNSLPHFLIALKALPTSPKKPPTSRPACLIASAIGEAFSP